MPALVEGMTPGLRAALAGKVFPWEVWARPEQIWPDGDWPVWTILAGRRFGKTRTGREYTHRLGMEGGHRIALVARTHGDLLDVMIDGESGLLSRRLTPPSEMPRHNPSKRRLTWPRPSVRTVAARGQIAVGTESTVATTFSSEEPNDIRGPVFSFAWCDELAAWTHLEACWSNLDFALTEKLPGWIPRRIVTTTPRPLQLLKDIIADPSNVTTGGPLYDNIDNLPLEVVEKLREKYEDTDLGEQEIWARILEEVKGALWKREWIERNRVAEAPELDRIVVAVDPPGASHPGAAEAGIIVVGSAVIQLGPEKRQDHFYVLDDRSLVGRPDEWGAEVVTAYEGWQADVVVGEVNFGGEMVEHTIATIDPSVAFVAVTASRGKKVRAGPVAIKCQQGLIHHVGKFRGLEDQQCTWVPQEGPSPDRVDAKVWGIKALEADFVDLPTSLSGLGDPDRQSPWR